MPMRGICNVGGFESRSIVGGSRGLAFVSILREMDRQAKERSLSFSKSIFDLPVGDKEARALFVSKTGSTWPFLHF